MSPRGRFEHALEHIYLETNSICVSDRLHTNILKRPESDCNVKKGLG